jgi:hypothetical protein
MGSSDIDRSCIVIETTAAPVADCCRPETAPWDIASSAPHAWAILADNAMKAGNVQRAEELVGLAYLAYDRVWPSANLMPACR